MCYTYSINSYMIRIIILNSRKIRHSESDIFCKNFLKKNINFQRKILSFPKTKRNYECYMLVYVLNACYIRIMPYICMWYVYICIVCWSLMFVFYIYFSWCFVMRMMKFSCETDYLVSVLESRLWEYRSRYVVTNCLSDSNRRQTGLINI